MATDGKCWSFFTERTAQAAFPTEEDALPDPMRDTLASALLGGSYPTDWNAFVGQERAKRQLLVATQSARLRDVACDHILLRSPIPGVGKTSLALLCAAEMGVGVKMVAGKVTLNEARAVLATMNDRDVLFYDEIHMAVAGGKAKAEWLLHVLQDRVILGPRGPEPIPEITVIGATTDAGRLPETILGRFPVQPVIEAYTDNEAAMIALHMSASVFGSPMPTPGERCCRAVARAANNNPRQMRALLTSVRDLAITSEGSNFDGDDYVIDEALQWFGLTEDGLDSTAQRYLVALLVDFQNQAGERAIADRLQETGGLGYTERVLIDKGYIARVKGGRTLTAPGIRRARDLAIARGA